MPKKSKRQKKKGKNDFIKAKSKIRLAKENGEIYAKVLTLFGNGMRGWKEQEPFDRIMVTAAGEDIPDELLYQLKDGGILIIPVGGQEETQHIIRVTRHGDDFDVKTLLPVKFVPLLSGIVHSS